MFAAVVVQKYATRYKGVDGFFRRVGTLSDYIPSWIKYVIAGIWVLVGVLAWYMSTDSNIMVYILSSAPAISSILINIILSIDWMSLFRKIKNRIETKKITDGQATRTQLLNTLNDMSASLDGIATELKNLTAEIKHMNMKSN